MGEDLQIPTWLMTLIAVGFFGTLGAIAFFIQHGRRVGFGRLARRYGLEYYEEPPRSVSLPLEFIQEVEQGIVVESCIRRALVGNVEGVEVALCELLRYRQSSDGRQQGYYSLTVAALTLPDSKLPVFSLQPEKLRHKIIDLAHGADIDFADSPGFSRRYLLRGEDVGRIREVINPPMRGFFERHPGRCVRCYGSEVVYYRPVRLLKWAAFRPSAVEQLLKESLEFARFFVRP